MFYQVRLVIVSVISTLVIITALGWWGRELVGQLLLAQLERGDNEAVATEQIINVGYEEHITEMVATANQAVVSVIATRDVPVYERYYEDIFDPFGWFGGGLGVPRVREQGTEEREVGGGSGFFVSADGHLVTNRHVVADTEARYSIVTSDGAVYAVTVLARDPAFDIAVLQVVDEVATEFPHLQFGDSDRLRLGETVVAIGNALAEFRNSVSRGVVSGLSRSVQARDQRGMIEQLDRVIQTDAAINLGNSGGPLLNLRGEVVGVNVAASLRAENVGFALPANMVAQIVRSVQETGEIVRPFLGVRHIPVTARLAELNNLPVSYGALVNRGQTPEELAVMPGSAAARAGIQEGDIIVQIGDRRLDQTSLAQAIRSFAVGETVEIIIWRDDTEITLQATLSASP